MINNIVQDTISIMKRPDRIQRQLLTEQGIEFNEKLGQWNKETEEILKNKSWKIKK